MEIEHGNLEDLFSVVVSALLGVVVQKAGGLDLRPGLEVVLAVAALDFDVCLLAAEMKDCRAASDSFVPWVKSALKLTYVASLRFAIGNLFNCALASAGNPIVDLRWPSATGGPLAFGLTWEAPLK